MTREELRALGFTEEQINQIMQLHGTATQGLRTQVSTLTADLAAARAISNPNPPAPNPAPEPTDPPANDTELQNALNRIKELERENTRKDIAAYATSKGLSGEQVENVLKAFGEDAEIAKSAIDSISQIISDNRAAAALAKEQELAGNASNPGGGSGGNGGGADEKSSAEKLAAKYFPEKKQGNSVLSHYINGGN